eukprot:CAMPEP_0195541584 /NCGR_PEP_ID=MMETSP0794_2-20130614/51160_1 /TAXON_ID=515487 /ORGANISM="Stephanopyxis turris, Strain CCMP 815" /LENGTH=1794 /DNA_ID=CAMNT_0040675687 /DNA_START=95 /DNA_END=5479 /DNA_ORIENTATION=+
MKAEKKDDFFPDPRPSCSEKDDEKGHERNSDYIHLNDVSRMSAYPNGTPVSRMFFPRCEADVLRVLQAAHSAGKQIGIRGTKHSMGGHSIASQVGWEIDCKYLRRIDYEEGYVVRCGPGCLWSDLIKALNAHGKSPRTMQSYCSFSVGGTLAVNAHGITTDYCFAESVVEFRLARITPEGEAKAIVCRPNLSHGKTSLSGDLFSLALGGYGLFGVITEVVLKVVDNVQLQFDYMHLDVQPSYNAHGHVSSSEFVRIYDNCRNSNKTDDHDSLGLGQIELKLARLNTVNLKKASFYVFRRNASSPTVSELPAAPRELSTASRLLYKWALPLLKDLRYAKEETSGKALDWTQHDASTRNQLLFESAVPLSRLYNPVVTKDDTFVLQEFFCPHDKFSHWIDAVTPIYKDIEAQQKKYNHDLILLNTTIRYVEQDDVTFLSYSRVPGGVFAFVLYYRIKRNQFTEHRLGVFHNQMAKVTVDLGGTFYLPYRKCYSAELLKAAYPMIERFAKLKESLDPNCVFSNLWFQNYILPLCSQQYRTNWTKTNTNQHQGDAFSAFSHPILPTCILPGGHTQILSEKEFLNQLPRKHQSNLLRRNGSYRNLLRSKELRDQFRTQFLVQIFHSADPEEVMRVMARAAWDPANQNDIHIYKHIHNHFHGSSVDTSINLASLPRFWRGIQQLRRQKEEITRETLSIVSKLGMLGRIHNYVCMGDNGKTVKPFVNEMNITGKIWIVHDKVYLNDALLPPIQVVLERGSLDSVAHEEIAYDYISDNANEKLAVIASDSIDLVTMNQGLHHIPIEKLYGFLTEVKRILRPGSIFITREHDLKLIPANTSSATSGEMEGSELDGKAPYPMLDLAHSIFNAVTGVSVKDETEEIRAFRPISEWRAMLESLGFQDSLIYEVEDGDPTWDEMICFCKPPATSSTDMIDKIPAHEEYTVLGTKKSPKESGEPPIIGLINTLLSQVPEFAASNATSVSKYLVERLPKIQENLIHVISVAIPYLITQNDLFGSESQTVAKQVTGIIEPPITAFFKQALVFAEGCLALYSQSELNTSFNFKNLLDTTELYLIMPYIQRKVQVEADDANELEKMIVSFLEQYLPSLLPQTISTEHDKFATNGTGAGDRSQASFDGFEKNKSEHSSSKKGTDEEDMTEVTPNEVQDFMEELAETLPCILDAESIMIQSGFTLPQQAGIVSQFGGNDFPSVCTKLAYYLDRRTWYELQSNLRVAVDSGDLPTKSRLLSAESGQSNSCFHPWHSVLMTFFKSPKVNLTQQAMFGLRLIGLAEITNLYKEAKKESKTDEAQPAASYQYDSSVLSFLRSIDSSLEEINKDWTDDIVERTITYTSNDKKETSLWDVAEVIEAWFGYTSITSRKVDITKQLRKIHMSIHANLANPEFNFHVPDGVQIGWLPIHEYLLVEMRNEESKQNEIGDTIRKGLVNVVSLGAAGNNQLKIKFRRLSSQNSRPQSGQKSASNQRSDSIRNALGSGHFYSLKLKAKELCTFLESNDILRADLHPNDGPYTWFKLNEWMQVEILDELVKSLEHTPWFRFPFLEFMTTYFTVFQQQCAIVQEKYGLVATYGSGSFLTDVVPGIVMTVLFSQLKLLAIPLQIALPNGYDKDRSRFLEDIVIRMPLNHDGIHDWDNHLKKTLDERILNARALPYDFMICSIPPFKAMGEILEKIAIRFPSARVFQISNQCEVQVRISLDRSGIAEDSISAAKVQHERDLQRLLSVAGVEQKMHYQYPNTHRSSPSEAATSDNMKTYYCLEVHCLALLDVFRICSTLSNHKVEQVYDFWK